MMTSENKILHLGDYSSFTPISNLPRGQSANGPPDDAKVEKLVKQVQSDTRGEKETMWYTYDEDFYDSPRSEIQVTNEETDLEYEAPGESPTTNSKFLLRIHFNAAPSLQEPHRLFTLQVTNGHLVMLLVAH